MRTWFATVTALTLASVPVVVTGLARAEDVFRPVLQGRGDKSCEISSVAAGCARLEGSNFEGYVYVRSAGTGGPSRDGISFNSKMTPALDDTRGFRLAAP